MKDTELRLGNLIKVDGEIQEVCELPLPENCTDENTKGIPLTEGWLVKFGFEKWETSGYKGVNGNPKFYYAKTTRIKDFIVSESYEGLTFGNKIYTDDFIIKHVHQLQNLYFALTGEELKTNES